MSTTIVPGEIYSLYFSNQPPEPGGKHRPGFFWALKVKKTFG